MGLITYEFFSNMSLLVKFINDKNLTKEDIIQIVPRDEGFFLVYVR